MVLKEGKIFRILWIPYIEVLVTTVEFGRHLNGFHGKFPLRMMLLNRGNNARTPLERIRMPFQTLSSRINRLNKNPGCK